ncbi:hypothetical protein OIE67_30885 [Nonomuraea fuscirosea]|uniref:hypothetical protein n=1 Tax=Nonomuraea fuscirosea TaxID=1291556 RepID=UPI002DD9DF90|nr:hypothetical protein [Nonomuraea fuscirosea]WSA48477.1 hypothetical protein OIE67_30885 [Nonomuraea fuscirosea]
MLESPPHMGFLLSITLTMTGAVMVSSAAKGRGWSVPVTIAGLAVLLGFSTATTNGLSALGGGVVDLPTAGMAFMSVLTVVMGAHALDRWGRRARRRRGAGGVPGVLLVVRPVGHPAVRGLARAADARLRHRRTGDAGDDAALPGAGRRAVELLFARAWRRGRSLARSGLVAGGIGGLAFTVTAPLQAFLLLGAPAGGEGLGGGDMGGGTAVDLILTVVCAVAAGAAAGFLGIRFGEMLRHLAPAREGR